MVHSFRFISFPHPPRYYCHTCIPPSPTDDGRIGICDVCAFTCHRGHELIAHKRSGIIPLSCSNSSNHNKSNQVEACVAGPVLNFNMVSFSLSSWLLVLASSVTAQMAPSPSPAALTSHPSPLLVASQLTLQLPPVSTTLFRHQITHLPFPWLRSLQ